MKIKTKITKAKLINQNGEFEIEVLGKISESKLHKMYPNTCVVELDTNEINVEIELDDIKKILERGAQ